MSDLIHRLKCKYPCGPIIEGKPEFGWRDFGGPAPEGMQLPSPIMIEAAERIEELEKALNDLLNDCINFDGGKLTDVFMEQASNTLKNHDA